VPQLGSASTNVAAIMDSGREQVLGSLLETLDVRSQVFQVVAIGESLDSRGRMTSRAVLRAIIHLSIDEDTSSGLLRPTVRHVYVQSL
jgi:hypothetical protein